MKSKLTFLFLFMYISSFDSPILKSLWLRFLQHRYIKILKRRGVLFQPLFYFQSLVLVNIFTLKFPFSYFVVKCTTFIYKYNHIYSYFRYTLSFQKTTKIEYQHDIFQGEHQCRNKTTNRIMSQCNARSYISSL